MGKRMTSDDIIRLYEKDIERLYRDKKLSFAKISELLGIYSGPTLYRYMKKLNKVRTREEQLADLKRSNTGRMWTEETKRNVSEGVKRSYERNKNLRSVRSEDNRKRWSKLSKRREKQNVGSGLFLVI